MKYIRLTDLVVSAEWMTKSNKALEAVKGANDKAIAVNARASVWGELKDQLASLSNEKCWYCETEQIRSDKHVDHYRPKNSVAEDESHPGYWWLAFNSANLRYSCAFCNCKRRDTETGFVGGKQDAFPLLNPESRVRSESEDLMNELPALLDPTMEDDSKLIYFESDGRVVPSIDEIQDPNAFKRAMVSIEQYHLNHSSIKRKRGDLYDEIRLAIEQAEDAWNPNMTGPSITRLRDSTLSQLLKFKNESQEYWAAAQLYLATFSDLTRRPWLQGVLLS